MIEPEPISLSPTQEDYQALWIANPLAKEQLKTIVLARLLNEERAKNKKEDEDSTPVGYAEPE